MNSQSTAAAREIRLHQFALVTVAAGVTIGLIAAAINWIARGDVAEAMLQGIAFAVVAAQPVWQSYRRLVRPA